MQQKQNTLHWFMHMVETGVINPINPDLSLIPEDIMSKIHWETLADGEIIPTQTAVTVTYFLFISSQIATQVQRKNGIPKELMATKKELFSAVERFLTLANLETLKRAGRLKYKTNGAWHDENAEILVSDLQPYPAEFNRSPMLKTFFNCN
jgi:hypothetical protein